MSAITQKEVIIEIHLKHLKLRVAEKTTLRVIWSRGKKQAKSQYKVLNEGLDTALFEEKFQITRIPPLDFANTYSPGINFKVAKTAKVSRKALVLSFVKDSSK